MPEALSNEEAQAKQLIKLKELQIAYRKTFLDTEHGKTVLKDLRENCGMDVDLFADNDRVEARNLGERRVFLHINTMLNTDFEELNAGSQEGE